ncbi:hypothetical protein DFA_09597 [Cavenderia fasciculata]|uniref:EGF-like domain-containing protein n=1 Tax=Cavenderia fasciculata TaxID=261658 RepID=F4Q826_CACFS|nr:uncharacterized protein DFA_09597 [Cavenderia fasciculata]EGG15926.1 hypothetical protein DFA_09597 [Cavenderia fasciculata]|eukprot:XP_004352251.1 hypothetical protein DFA_09597 [Cavenderia fasciculata]
MDLQSKSFPKLFDFSTSPFVGACGVVNVNINVPTLGQMSISSRITGTSFYVNFQTPYSGKLLTNYGNNVYNPDVSHFPNLTALNTLISSIPDVSIISTNLTVPPGFTCNIQFASMDLPLINGFGIIKGTNVGWGYTLTGSYALTPIIPNQILSVNIKNLLVGPKKPYTLQLNGNTPQYSYPFNVIEVGIIINKNVQPLPPIQLSFKAGFNVTFTLFNPFVQHIVTVVDQLSSSSNISCTIKSNSTNWLYCETTRPIQTGVYNISVQNVYNSQSTMMTFTETYPLGTAFSYDSSDPQTIYIYGDFGANGQQNASVQLNQTNCNITSINQTSIICKLDVLPPKGLASVHISIDSYNFTRLNAILFTSGGGGGINSSDSQGSEESNPLKDCIVNTSNCFGHGQCDENGVCQCDTGFNPLDNCLTEFKNSTPIIDPTKPTTSFDIDGVDFKFEIVSVQELDLDESIVKELPSDIWQSTINSTLELTVAQYKLNTTNSTIVGPETEVTATISFSSLSRTVDFGLRQIVIDPNAIKLAVNISGWDFESNLSYLRVVFRTEINNDQSFAYDCEDYNVDSLSFDSLNTSLQYLRVIKGDAQFNGRFIDYSLANGRPTYSRVQLISLTPSSNDDDTSVATIGVLLSQCQECLLDPDFTPLLINKDESKSCDKKVNWRLIVGVVVGGTAAIALATATGLQIRRKRIERRFNAKMKSKLANMNKQ